MKQIAHRGLSNKAPENTLVAFQLALDEGFSAIELDVRASIDGEFFVIHDAKLDRTTSGSGTVSKSTSQYICELDAGSWFGERFASTKVPRLSEVLDFLPDHIEVHLEVKFKKKNLVEKLCEYLNGLGSLSRVVVSSFSIDTLITIRRYLPNIKIACLIKDYMISLNELMDVNPDFICPNIEKLDNAGIQFFKKHQFDVRVWGVGSDLTLFKKAVDLGVYGATVDCLIK